MIMHRLNLLALTVIVLLTVGLSVPCDAKILIGPEIGPTQLFNNSKLFTIDQSGLKADTFAYGYMQRAGFNYDWTSVAAVTNPTIRWALEKCSLKAYIMPDVININGANTEKINTLVAWKAEQNKSNLIANEQSGAIYRHDFFGSYNEDSENLNGYVKGVWVQQAENRIMFQGSAARFQDVADGIANNKVLEGYRWPGCFMIADEYYSNNGRHVNYDSTHTTLLDSMWANPRDYFAFWGEDDTLHLWLKMMRTTTNDLTDNLPMVRLWVRCGYDAAHTNIDTFTWRTGDISDTEYQYYHFKTKYWYRHKYRAFALQWLGGDRVAVSHIAYADDRYMKVNPDSLGTYTEADADLYSPRDSAGNPTMNAAQYNDYCTSYLAMFLTSFSNQLQAVGLENSYGFWGEEVWQYAYHSFAKMKHEMPNFLNDLNTLEDANPYAPPLVGASPGYGADMLEDFCEEADPGILSSDSYPIYWTTSDSTTTNSRSVQLAWDRYINARIQWQDGLTIPPDCVETNAPRTMEM